MSYLVRLDGFDHWQPPLLTAEMGGMDCGKNVNVVVVNNSFLLSQ
jgi:hypothetical protein